MIRKTCTVLALALALVPHLAEARTITVGPSGRDFTQIRDVFSSQNLAPGDVVLVDGGSNYASVVIGNDDDGSVAAPVVLRWNGSGTRPRISGGVHSVKFENANHVVVEGFEITAGSSTCVFNEGHGNTVRDAVIRDCPAHGILGADIGSGSFTLEFSEIMRAGAGTTKHPIYMQSDQMAYPGAVFTMRFNYVHDGNGGNLLKSRHERNVIHYNWFENAAYQAIELIGPDCQTQASGWTPQRVREDSDVVGNVFVHTSSWSNVARLGGDLNGRSMGRVRFVGNSFIVDRTGSVRMVLVQLGLQSLEMHNNLFYQSPAGAPTILAENPASSVDTPVCAPFDKQPWTQGRNVWGSYNWIESGSTSVPVEWGATRQGSNPGLADVMARLLRPTATSPLVNMGSGLPAPFPGFEQPGVPPRPLFDPPPRRKIAPGEQLERMMFGPDIDIGAFESVSIEGYPIAVNGSRPLLPPTDPSTLAVLSPASTAAFASPRATHPPSPMARLVHWLRSRLNVALQRGKVRPGAFAQ